MSPLTAGAVACAVLAVLMGVVGAMKGGSLQWLWGTPFLLGLVVILMAAGGDPRDAAFPMGREPALLAGSAFSLAGLLMLGKVLGDRRVVAAGAALQDILAATLLSAFAGVALLVARRGAAVFWLSGSVVAIVAVGVWIHALRKLWREFEGEERER